MSTGAIASRSVPPPRLHWGWVLLLSALTSNLFGVIWLLVQANWVRQVCGSSRAFKWCVAALIMSVLALPVSFYGNGSHSSQPAVSLSVLFALVSVADVIVWFTAVFSLRSELSYEPIGIPLGPVMTVFFSSVYFQYHLRDYPVEGIGYIRHDGLGLETRLS